ncbi:hypothetical protein N8972_00015 [Sulfurospirillum sp.]|nr:hypothetical protein [Sulfurospirillum sp.]
MKKLELEYKKEIDISLNERFKKEILKADRTNQVKKEDYNLDVIEVSKDKSLLGYILIKKNFSSITTSKKQKRSKNHMREIIFTGFNQPSKKPHQVHLKASYDVLKAFVYRFRIVSFDISIDGLKNIYICNKNKYTLNGFFSEFINSKSLVEVYKTSYYVNNPFTPNPSHRFSLERVLVYDKHLKEGRYKGKPIKWDKLKQLPTEWKRLELTIKVNNEKLNISLLDEVVEYSKLLSKSFFGSSFYDDILLQSQMEFLKLRG